ncbi:Dihydrokaempferol 4-reductase [Handroanthus impetiginosus]|uniref:Dihydrokaempferol 4-reductase n=1 Tax=Handroanthus impetiginosus TaxID=429701 RepID=A0A2G9GWC1_9LAMI|nr:Dihydrokaempferol 4-reductase [Handroanthus impetiginosus]
MPNFSSVEVIIPPNLKRHQGDPKLLPILSSVNSRMGSMALVHIEDICSAHIFLMEHPDAEGRYICCAESCVMSELVWLLKKQYPCSIAQRVDSTEQDSVPSKISSKKIRDMGFNFECSIQDIIHQTVEKCVDCGFLLPAHHGEREKNM